MLSVTCDAFIHTLDECVKLATGDTSSSSSTLPDEISTSQQTSAEIDLTMYVIQFMNLFSNSIYILD